MALGTTERRRGTLDTMSREGTGSGDASARKVRTCAILLPFILVVSVPYLGLPSDGLLLPQRVPFFQICLRRNLFPSPGQNTGISKSAQTKGLSAQSPTSYVRYEKVENHPYTE